MSEAKLTKTRVRAGIWEGVLSGDSGAKLEAIHQEQPLPGVSLTPIPDQAGQWLVKVPIPAAILSEGVQTILLRNPDTGEKLAHFTIITGVAMEDDLRAEVDLLRAELDMLKRAFRRHCLETAA